MAPIKVVLLACGSFNPPTNMHLRMFEVARDNLNRLGPYFVMGGIISPVHDAYGKKDLAPSSYRCEMLKLALESSDWIRLSTWECSQDTWTRTRQVLQYHQNVLNAVLNNENNVVQNENHINANINDSGMHNWITNDIRNCQGPVHIKLLCGADFLQTFELPDLWNEADIETIIHRHGLVVISRQGYDPYHFIYESDVLTKHKNNIVVINEWITNEISSTKIRRALRRQESVKYLIQDSVIDFIRKNGLYGSPKDEIKYSSKSVTNENLRVSCLDDYILTPSPSDVNMKSVHGSGDSIFLELNAVSDIVPSPSDQKISCSIQSKEAGELYEREKNMIKSDSCTDFPYHLRRSHTSPQKTKKVSSTVSVAKRGIRTLADLRKNNGTLSSRSCTTSSRKGFKRNCRSGKRSVNHLV